VLLRGILRFIFRVP